MTQTDENQNIEEQAEQNAKEEQTVKATQPEQQEMQPEQQEMQPAEWYKKKSFAKTDTVYQMEISECGAASLSMVMGYYGVHVSLESLRVQTGVSRNGVNAKNICEAAKNNGFIANGYRRDIDRLLEATAMPCILHWDFNHFVVLEGCRFGRFHINNPATGRETYSREEMEEHFTGVVLEFIPTDNIVKQKSERTLLRFARERLAGQGKYLAVLFALGLALIVPGVLSPVFSRVFLDDILVQGQNTLAKWVLLGMILTALYKAYFSFVKERFALKFTTKMTLESVDELINHLFRLPLTFFEQRMSGDILQRVQNDARVSAFLSGKVVSLVLSLITSTVYLVIMLLYDVKLTMIGVAFCVLSMGAVYFTSKRIADYAQINGIDNARLTGFTYSGMLVSSSIKASGAENELTAKALGYSALVQQSDYKLGRIQQSLNIIPEAIGSVSNILVLILGSRLIIDGDFTPGILIAFTGFLGSFTGPFGEMVGFARDLHQLKNDMGRVDDLMRYEEDECFNPKDDLVITEGRLKGEVELRDISFAYGSLDRPVVKDINLKLEPGKTVAFVGNSGCGKSTVAKLVTSLYRPWTGEILFDGISSDRIAREVLSDSMAVVTQNITLLEGTIYDNITGWDDNIPPEAVVKAAKDACIHDEILMKDGNYDYLLSSGGSNISGGQRQRLAIAKALADNPSILVLDEATSFLDTITEKKVYEHIKQRGCTCIVIAQRLSSIKNCDEIIVLKNGRIIERGTHRELMELKEHYYELVTKSQN